MNEDASKVRELIATNKTEQAFSILVELAKNDSELLNQILTLKARFNDIRKKENLNLIASSEAFIIRSQINYALLNLVDDSHKGLIVTNPTNQKTVFISYNHNDMETAEKLYQKLKAEGFKIIWDVEKTRTGEDIETFIKDSIRKATFTISLISSNSLKSAWVAMETIINRYAEIFKENRFIPVYIDKEFLERDFTDKVLDDLDEHIRVIDTKITERTNKNRGIEDLQSERTRLRKLISELPEIIGRLRNSVCTDISDVNFENGVSKIIREIRDYQ